MRAWGDCDLYRMKQVRAYIALRGSLNIIEMADVPPDFFSSYASPDHANV